MLCYVKKLYYLIYLFGFILLGQELGEITIYNTNNSNLVYNQLNCLEFDSENRLWIGTQNGLSVFNETENSWINISNNNLPTNIITALEFNNWNETYSNMFVGTFEGLALALWESELTGTQEENITWYAQYGATCSPNNGIISTLLYDNELWSGSPEGLCVEGLGPEGSWLLQNTETEFYSNNITSITKNINNDIIAIGTMNGGLVTYDNEFNIYYSSNSNILDNTVFDVAFDQNNNIIICTPQAGLGVLTENGSWVWLNTVNSMLPTNSLKKIVVDNNNDLWITTLENGLIHYKNNTFYNYTIDNSNLPDNKINCLKFGPNNHLWLGTDTAGLVKINTPIMSVKQEKNNCYNVYPSVFHSFINIDLDYPSNISIFNQQGQLINRYNLTNQKNTLSMQEYKPGIYLIRIQSKKETLIKKLIKY